jgi:hypothetical protein
LPGSAGSGVGEGGGSEASSSGDYSGRGVGGP